MSESKLNRTQIEALASKWCSAYVNGCGGDGWAFTRSGLAEFVRAIEASCDSTCTWTKDPDDEYMPDTWDSACGEKWTFNDGGPIENSVRFCQGCGKTVKLAGAQPPAMTGRDDG